MAEPDRDPLDFTGRVVVVTGGTRGVGRGIATGFLGRGADVVVCSRHEPDSLPDAAGRQASFVAADVRHADQAAAVVDTALSRHGRLDVLVNNAGGAPSVAAAEASPNFFSSVVALNLSAAFFCAQAANAVMQTTEHGGSIVNIASVSGVRPSPGAAAYGAAKAGLLNLTQTLAIEWAPRVRVNAVVAGMLATEHAGDQYGGGGAIAAVSATVPLGRLGTPSDVADVCLFLSSTLARYVSGAAVALHGGGEPPVYLGALNH